MGPQATAHGAEKGQMKSGRERERELSWLVEEGDRVALEAPAVLSQMGVILEQNICSLPAHLLLCVL